MKQRLIDLFLPVAQYLVAAAFLSIPAAVVWWWPMSWWLEVDTVHVNDSRVDEPITMLVSRRVKTPFTGTYRVTIYRWNPNGPEAFCTMRGSTWPYRTDAAYPIPLTLAWWTEHDAKCNRRIPGQYQMTTEWTKPGDWLLPDKHLTVVSNIYRIEP